MENNNDKNIVQPIGETAKTPSTSLKERLVPHIKKLYGQLSENRWLVAILFPAIVVAFFAIIKFALINYYRGYYEYFNIPAQLIIPTDTQFYNIGTIVIYHLILFTHVFITYGACHFIHFHMDFNPNKFIVLKKFKYIIIVILLLNLMAFMALLNFFSTYTIHPHPFIISFIYSAALAIGEVIIFYVFLFFVTGPLLKITEDKKKAPMHIIMLILATMLFSTVASIIGASGLGARAARRNKIFKIIEFDSTIYAVTYETDSCYIISPIIQDQTSLNSNMTIDVTIQTTIEKKGIVTYTITFETVKVISWHMAEDYDKLLMFTSVAKE